MDEVVSSERGAVLKDRTDEGRTLHSGDESTGSKGLTEPKPPAAQAKSPPKCPQSASEHYLWIVPMPTNPPDPAPAHPPPFWSQSCDRKEQCHTSPSSLLWPVPPLTQRHQPGLRCPRVLVHTGFLLNGRSSKLKKLKKRFSFSSLT